MKKIFLGLLLLSSVPMMGEKTVKFDFQTSEARTLDVYPTTFVQPLVAEVVVDTRTGRIRDMWTLSPADYNARVYPDNTEGTLQNLRAYALFKSSDKHNCDLIVAPTFDIKISDEGAVINVTGYPANFANWATGTKADYDWIKLQEEKKTK